jgi:hypothetical protein
VARLTLRSCVGFDLDQIDQRCGKRCFSLYLLANSTFKDVEKLGSTQGL